MSIDIQKKILSLCMCGRDDDYMPDFIYRIETTLNYLSEGLARFKALDRVELVVTDWGSSKPFAKSLRLTPPAAKITRFIYVPNQMIRSIQGGEDYFHNTRALNVALRRAQGEFILATNADQLMQEFALRTLLDLLDKKIKIPIALDRALFMLPRLQVPWQFVKTRPDMDAWDRFIQMNDFAMKRENTGLMHCFGASGGLMMHREEFLTLRGFDESHIGWGWSDIDLGLRASQEIPFFWTSGLGITMYHMGHEPTDRRNSALLKPNKPTYTPLPTINDEKWGLGGEWLEEMRTAGCSFDIHGSGLTVFPRKSQKQIFSDENKNELRALIFSVQRRGWAIENRDVNALFILSWYCRMFLPVRYLEVGIGRSYSALLVGIQSPASEIYGIDYWQGIIADNPVVRLTHALVEEGFQGRIHFVNGPVFSSFGRVKSILQPKERIGLALMRLSAFGKGDIPTQIDALLSLLEDSACVVIIAESEIQLMQVNSYCEQLLSVSSYIFSWCDDGLTGVILKVSEHLSTDKAGDDPLILNGIGADWLESTIAEYMREERRARSYSRRIGIKIGKWVKKSLAKTR